MSEVINNIMSRKLPINEKIIRLYAYKKSIEDYLNNLKWESFNFPFLSNVFESEVLELEKEQKEIFKLIKKICFIRSKE